MSTLAPEPSEEGLRCLDAILAHKRAALGREPTLAELERWADTYEATAGALRAHADERRALAKPLSPAPVPAPKETTPRPAPRKARAAGQAPLPRGKAASPRVLPSLPIARLRTPEEVLANRPLKPPGKGRTT